MSRRPLRILTTNDFVGSFFPQTTSYGRLPGAGGLLRTVDALRAEVASSVWIDAGDLMQGSALGAITDGTWGFLAAATFGIDAGVIGNHELDWGLAHLRRWANELPYPLLASNADLGFAPATMLDTGVHRVGVVGATYPQMAYLHPGVATAPDTAGTIKHHAERLRTEGADVVVLAVHDGVDLDIAAGHGAPGIGLDRMERFCASLDGRVDLVLGGHTLACHHGRLGGIPYLQPWPFGGQLGIADIDPGGDVALTTVDVDEPAPWTAPGSAAYAALDAEIAGTNPQALASAPGRDDRLVQAIADGVLTADDTVDIAVVGPRDVWNQAPRDGTYAYLPAGPVSRAQLLRLAPCTGARSAWGGQLVTTEATRDDADRMVDALTTASYAPDVEYAAGTAAVARRDPARTRQRIAVPPFYAARLDEALGTRFPWTPTTTTWRDALLHLPWIGR